MTGTEHVYCAVQTEFLSLIVGNFFLEGLIRVCLPNSALCPGFIWVKSANYFLFIETSLETAWRKYGSMIRYACVAETHTSCCIKTSDEIVNKLLLEGFEGAEGTNKNSLGPFLLHGLHVWKIRHCSCCRPRHSSMVNL